ncbi:MAG: aldo/keto reductase [Clostridia bacterium]|nr:aldo/keto reductase [Clostridia bacterium]
MKYIERFIDRKDVSRIALGCMRISGMTDTQADEHINNALECGINYFDHADIYGGGKCEEVFGGVLKRNPSLRDKMIIQTKCGIRDGMYDFSKEHIISAVDGSLKRLGIDHIDVLLLHRPDLLMEPEQVAEAFNQLEKEGKVGKFGVSNHNPAQIELLQRTLSQRIIINQVQLSVPHAWMISSGANVNMTNDEGIVRDGGLRDYCRLNGILIQPWSPLQRGFIAGAFLKDEKYEELTKTLTETGEKYGITATGAAIAWLLRLPEKMQPVTGTTDAGRLKEIAKAADIEMSREDWYKIYTAAGYRLP